MRRGGNERDGDVDFTYWEVPEMGHGIAELEDTERRQQIRTAMVNWLFGREPGPGGPPLYGLAPDERHGD